MIKRILSGVILCFIFLLLPVLGNLEFMMHPQLWILLIVSTLASILQPAYNPVTIFSKQADHGTGAQIIWSVYITQLIAITESAYLQYPASMDWNRVTTIALSLMVIGLALRTWAVYLLGPRFTMHMGIQKNHSIVRSGPYRIVRHPSYLGAYILYVSTTLFLHAWIATALTLIILPLAFFRRIHYEDKMLCKEFGQEYKSYCLEVKKFIPWVY